MWLRLGNWNAQRLLCPRSLVEVSYKSDFVLDIVQSIPQSTGLNVVEVAHDMQLAVGWYVKQDLELLNSFDTWHGMCLISYKSELVT